MKRFLRGLAAGGVSAGLTWLLSRHVPAAVVVGLLVALVVWIGSFVRALGNAAQELAESLEDVF